jgi:hypothetical protein
MLRNCRISAPIGFPNETHRLRLFPDQVKKMMLERLMDNSLLSTAYHEFRLRRSLVTRGEPILVYQMGKVGSSSIVRSLNALTIDQPVYQVHFLNTRNINRAQEKLRSIYGRRHSVNRWALYESRFVVKHLIRDSGRALKVISLVRDPVARNLSSFFQNINIFIPDCETLYKSGRIGVQEITEQYFETFHEHDLPLTWFDEEMKNVFGIDIYSTEPVSSAERVYMCRNAEVEVLVMRMEDINDVAENAVRRFLQLDEFQLEQANVGSKKTYAQVYADFRKQVKLPESYLSKMYDSKFARHFYSSEEIESFRRRWLPD